MWILSHLPGPETPVSWELQRRLARVYLISMSADRVCSWTDSDGTRRELVSTRIENAQCIAGLLQRHSCTEEAVA
jgi:hypothetical protein